MISDITIHNDQLISFRRGTGTEYENSLFFNNLIRRCLIHTQCLISENYRPEDMFYLDVLETAEKIIDPERVLLDDRGDFFSEYIFYLEKKDFNDKIAKVIDGFWIYYQHASLIFFTGVFPKHFKDFSAQQICSIYQAIVVYKGMQENVFWIEKHPSLLFPEIEDL